MGTTVKDAICFHAVSDDFAIAMLALGRKGMNRAFKAIEEMGLTIPDHFNGFVVIVSADFTLDHKRLLATTTYERSGVLQQRDGRLALGLVWRILRPKEALWIQ